MKGNVVRLLLSRGVILLVYMRARVIEVTITRVTLRVALHETFLNRGMTDVFVRQ